MHPILTKCPVCGEELIATRLHCPHDGIGIEGQFELGWIGKLSREQLEFVELMVKNRGNVNGVAADLHMAYNTARSRLDDIIAALGYGVPIEDQRVDRRAVLDRLASKEISVEEAMKLLRG